MYKTSNSSLVGVQVTRQLTTDVKKVKTGPVLDLLERLGLTAADANKLHLVLVPHPKMQGKARLVLVDSTRGEEDEALVTADEQPVDGDAGNDTSISISIAAAGTVPAGVQKGKKKKVMVKADELGLKEYTVWGIPLDYGLRYVGLK